MSALNDIPLIRDLLALDGENDFCEFKQNQDNPEKIGHLISAISNSATLEGEPFGYVIWGIEDTSKKVVGTKFNFSKKTPEHQQPLQLWLAQRLQPSITFKFSEYTDNDVRVVVLQIPAANSVPTKFSHIAYIRIGEATPKLADYPAREAALVAKLRPYVWEKSIAIDGLNESDVSDYLDVDGYARMMKCDSSRNYSDIIKKLFADSVLLREIGRGVGISNLGAILFAKDMNLFEGVKRKTMRVIQYDGKSKAKTIVEIEGKKGYAVGFEGLIKYILDKTPKNEEIVGGLRTTKYAYPEIMVRESVANALIHQDFALSGTGPMTEIYLDRIEVTNPGAPLIEPSRVIDMPPQSRNEAIASLMRRLNICEERGSGLDKIIDAAESNTLPAPDFRADGQSSKTIVYGPRIFRDTTPTERVRACYQHAVMRFLKGERMTNSSLRQRLGIDDRNAAQVSRIIAEALEERLIKQSDSWSTRAGSYVPIWA